MPKIEYLHNLTGIGLGELSKDEVLLLEAALLGGLCGEIANQYQSKDVKYNTENYQRGAYMKNHHFIFQITHDLIKSNDYTISGIANYSDTPEEVIIDIAIGNNNNPSIDTTLKIIDLHRQARPDLYKRMMNKIIESLIHSYATKD